MRVDKQVKARIKSQDNEALIELVDKEIDKRVNDLRVCNSEALKFIQGELNILDMLNKTL